jgi:hypothetical protein
MIDGGFHNAGVGGPSPPVATIFSKTYGIQRNSTFPLKGLLRASGIENGLK